MDRPLRWTSWKKNRAEDAKIAKSQGFSSIFNDFSVSQKPALRPLKWTAHLKYPRRHLHKRGGGHLANAPPPSPNMRSRDWRLLVIPMVGYTSLDSRKVFRMFLGSWGGLWHQFLTPDPILIHRIHWWYNENFLKISGMYIYIVL